jgi:hypothetical protein
MWPEYRVSWFVVLPVTICSPSLMWIAVATLSPAAQLFTPHVAVKMRCNAGENVA